MAGNQRRQDAPVRLKKSRDSNDMNPIMRGLYVEGRLLCARDLNGHEHGSIHQSPSEPFVQDEKFIPGAWIKRLSALTSIF